jgi:hypothetical protein
VLGCVCFVQVEGMMHRRNNCWELRCIELMQVVWLKLLLVFGDLQGWGQVGGVGRAGFLQNGRGRLLGARGCVCCTFGGSMHREGQIVKSERCCVRVNLWLKFCSCLFADDEAGTRMYVEWICCVKCRRLGGMGSVVCKNAGFSASYEQLQVVELSPVLCQHKFCKYLMLCR